MGIVVYKQEKILVLDTVMDREMDMEMRQDVGILEAQEQNMVSQEAFRILCDLHHTDLEVVAEVAVFVERIAL